MPEYVRLKIVKDRKKYTEVLTFSAWVAYGAVIQIAREQTIPIFLNAFFNTLMNAAYAVSAQVKAGINMFAANLSKPISPQITKNYVSGNFERCNQLMVSSSKLSFLALLAISSPFIVDTNYVLSIWLDKVPEYTTIFTRLVIIEALVSTVNLGISEYIFASGRIKNFQIWVNTVYLLGIIASFLVLQFGGPPQSVLYAMIGASAANVIVRQLILHFEFGYDNMILVRGSYLPSLLVLILFLPAVFLSRIIHPLIAIVIAVLWLAVLILSIGLTKQERGILLRFVKQLRR